MNLDFLDDTFSSIGRGLADTDKFVDREMPFDSGWGFPAAIAAMIAASIYAPQTIPAMVEAGAGAEGAGATAGSAGGSFGGAEMLSSIGGSGGSFGGDLFQLGGSAGAEGSIGSGGMNSLLSSLGLDGGGSFAGQSAFQLPSSAYTPEYLNMLADYQGVDAGNVGLFDRLMGNTEQSLYKQEGALNKQQRMSVANMLKNQAQQRALGGLMQTGANMLQQGQQSPQTQVPQAMMRKGQGIDTTSALLSLLQDQKMLRQPRLSLI
jgi:hypothetical protein